MQDRLTPRPVIVVFTALTLLAAIPLTVLAMGAGIGGAWLAWIFLALKTGAAAAVLVPLVVGIAVGFFRAYRVALFASIALGLGAFVNAALFYSRVPSAPYLDTVTLVLSAVGAIIGAAYLLFAWVLYLGIRNQERASP